MKWNDLTLKERKRIYDSVKSNNPNITYLELKEQFDNIPAYEDGIAIIDSNTDYVIIIKKEINEIKYSEIKKNLMDLLKKVTD